MAAALSPVAFARWYLVVRWLLGSLRSEGVSLGDGRVCTRVV